MTRSWVFLFFIQSTIFIVNAKLPFAVPTCKRDSSDYALCLKKVLQQVWTKVIPGVPELGIPSLEPYHIQTESFDLDMGDINAKIRVKNVKAYGALNILWQSIKPHHSKDYFKMDANFTTSRVFAEGDYKAEGGFGTFKQKGRGKFNLTLDNLKSTVHLEGPIVNDRWVIKEFKFRPEIGDLKFWASNLNKENDEITAAILSVINDYWRDFLPEILPFAENIWNNAWKNLTNEIMKNVPFSEIFP